MMDWMSRYILSWELSVEVDVDFCIMALERAFTVGTPEIFNSDQGSQFTSLDFIKQLKQKDIQISMDGRGKLADNIFNERLWRSVKYEEVYINDYMTFYNQERPHQSLNYKTPAEVYFGSNSQRKSLSCSLNMASYCSIPITGKIHTDSVYLIPQIHLLFKLL